MVTKGFDFHIEGDWPTIAAVTPTMSEYTNPDPDGDGIAYNGKRIFTVEQAASYLNRDGDIWKVGPDGQITYTFLDRAPTGQYNSPKNYSFLGSYVEGFSPFTAEQREATREAIGLWDDLIAPTFVEKKGAGAADIVYMNTSTGPAQAAAYTPFYQGGHGKYQKIQGDTFVNQDQSDNFDLDYGGYGQTTLVHETGHAIGLLHPGDYNFSDDNDGDGQPDPITYAGDAFYFQDSLQYTIMSYFHAGNTGAKGYVNWYTGFAQTPQTPMVHDIAAAQQMYGADLTTRTGDTTYGFNSTADRDVFDFTVNENPFLAIYDAGGHDTLDFSGWTRNSVLDLNEGGFSSGFGATVDIGVLNPLWGVNFTQAQWEAIFNGQTRNPGFLSDNISIAHGTVIEDGVTGSGNDRLIGNAVANRLDGGDGSDVLTGNAGADVFAFNHKGDVDRITDFVSGEDKIDLSGLLDSEGCSFIGGEAFGGNAGEVRFADGRLTGDLDGDGIADFTIEAAAIVASDILVA